MLITVKLDYIIIISLKSLSIGPMYDIILLQGHFVLTTVHTPSRTPFRFANGKVTVHVWTVCYDHNTNVFQHSTKWTFFISMSKTQ